MKHIFTGMMMALALVTALIVGVVALAESAAPEVPELPAVEEAQPETPQTEQQPAADAATDNTALQQAFDAYRAAKQSTRQEALEEELKGYVESGKLTQAQADLILNYYKEQQALRDGTCPSCGYQFQNGSGKGGRMNGGRGMNGGKGSRMNGNRGAFNNQQPGSGQQMPGQADGTSFVPDALTMPSMNVNDGI